MNTKRIGQTLRSSAALLIAGVASTVLAQAPPTTHLAGNVSSDDAGIFELDGVEIAVAGTTLSTETSFDYYQLDVPAGPHSLEISGVCVEPQSLAVDIEGATESLPLTVHGVVPTDPAVHYRCDPYSQTSAAHFAAPLLHRAAVSPSHAAAISLLLPVTFDGHAYRKVYVMANGWLSFTPVTLSKLPPCEQLTLSNAPANALFAYAGCAMTTSVTYEVVPGNTLVVRWHLVDPSTAKSTDVEVNFGPSLTLQDNVIEVAYGSLGDPGQDGGSTVVGLTTASGAAFPIGVRQPILRPFHAIQLTPTPTIKPF